MVPNKYPAVRTADASTKEVSLAHENMPAVGRHEVIVESAEHKTCFAELTTLETRLACIAYRDRLQVAKEAPGIKFAHVFKNRGPAAGASLEHVHTQLIALPAVPSRVSRMIENARRMFDCREPILTNWLDRENGSDERIVEQTDNLIAYCPYAARFPYETRIAPVEGASDFLNTNLELIHEFANLLQRTIRRIEHVSGRAAYNFLLNVPPFENSLTQHFPWQVELFPRLSTPAGFEWATGWFINPILPEEGARALRDARFGELERNLHNNSSGNNG